jgi:hypothetical protein
MDLVDYWLSQIGPTRQVCGTSVTDPALLSQCEALVLNLVDYVTGVVNSACSTPPAASIAISDPVPPACAAVVNSEMASAVQTANRALATAQTTPSPCGGTLGDSSAAANCLTVAKQFFLDPIPRAAVGCSSTDVFCILGAAVKQVNDCLSGHRCNSYVNCADGTGAGTRQGLDMWSSLYDYSPLVSEPIYVEYDAHADVDVCRQVDVSQAGSFSCTELPLSAAHCVKSSQTVPYGNQSPSATWKGIQDTHYVGTLPTPPAPIIPAEWTNHVHCSLTATISATWTGNCYSAVLL